MGTVEDGLFDYDLGFGEQQLNSNSQVITSSSQSPRDFPKQTSLNTISSLVQVNVPDLLGGRISNEDMLR